MQASITYGTDNVFADLGMPNAAERQTRTRLAMAIHAIFKARRLRQADAGRLVAIPQSSVSALVNYRLDGFSVERLMGFLTALDQDLEIMIRPSRTQGRKNVFVCQFDRINWNSNLLGT